MGRLFTRAVRAGVSCTVVACAPGPLPETIGAAADTGFSARQDTVPSGTTPGRITGRVLSPDGIPIPNALVGLAGTGRRTIASTTGSFTFDSVPPGEHVVVVSAIGYAAPSRMVDLAAGEAVDITIGGRSAPLTFRPAGGAVDVFVIPTIRWTGPSCPAGSLVRACPMVATKRALRVDEELIVWSTAEPLEIVQACQGRIARITHLQPSPDGPNVVTVRCT